MLTTTEQNEYLAEIRSEVCAHCVERPPGGPPCEPLGKICGVEMHLAELVDAIHAVQSTLAAPYFESAQKSVCGSCAFRHSRFCPCPMDYLLVLIAEAVEAVDARHARRDLVQRRLANGGEGAAPDVRTIRRIYEEASGTWRGCDWRTTFGRSGLDLNGCSAAQAQTHAKASADAIVAADWQAAAQWLAHVETHAAAAEQHAAQAVRAAAAGRWLEALEQARQAWSSEFATGRMVWRGFPMTWQRLFLAIEAAVPDNPDVITPAGAASKDES